MLYRGDDNRRLARLKAIAETAFVPLIAVNDVLYHVPERRALQDVMTCIREHVTIDRAGRLLEANAERHLKVAAGDGAHFPPRAGGDRPHAAFPRPLQFLARRIEEHRIPGREPRRLCNAAGCARGAGRGRIPAPLSERRSSEGPLCARPRTRDDDQAQVRKILPDRLRHRQLRALQGHPVPGARFGGEFRHLLLPWHHRGRSGKGRSPVRALRLKGTRRAARHRRRFRARSPRRGDPARL